MKVQTAPFRGEIRPLYFVVLNHNRLVLVVNLVRRTGRGPCQPTTSQKSFFGKNSQFPYKSLFVADNMLDC